MKNMKQVKALLLAALMLSCVMLFAACGETLSAEADYKVTVKDAQGNPITEGYAVRFMQNGQQVAMQLPNAQGEAVKTLTRGDYVVELQFTDNDVAYHYDSADLTLSAEKTELTLELAYALPEQGQSLFAGGTEMEAFRVGVGSTYIELDAENRSYFLFAPTQAGLYEFTLLNNDAAIGYYGAPHFVQDRSAVEVVDNKFSISIRADSIGTGETGSFVLVIGVDAGQGSGLLSITRLGDPEWTVADEPWTVYQAKAQVAEFSLPENTKLVDFDLTAATDTYNLVYNEADGYYHLNSADGPLVLVRLGKNSGTKYVDPLGKMIETSAVVKYFYDADGNFQKKESYTECLYSYCDGLDTNANGTIEEYYYLDKATETYPLTEDLKYIIEQRGDYVGWFDPESNMYLFKTADGLNIPGINNEIAWLFMCCYVG